MHLFLKALPIDHLTGFGGGKTAQKRSERKREPNRKTKKNLVASLALPQLSYVSRHQKGSVATVRVSVIMSQWCR